MARSTNSRSPLLYVLLVAGLAAVIALFVFLRDGDEGPKAAADRGSEQETSDPGSAIVAAGDAGPSVETRASGTVRSSEGPALEGALVTLVPLFGEGEPITARSDAEGAWELAALPSGRYAISATAPEHLRALLPELHIAAASDNAGIHLRLEPGGNRLSGSVEDITGGIIEGAMVRLTPVAGVLDLRERESFFAATDEQGRYAIQVPDGRFRVQVSHPDYSGEQAVLALEGGDRSRDFALVPMGVIAGVVVREGDGEPVAEATVSWARERTMMVAEGERVSVAERGGKVRADEQGRFVIRGLPPGVVSLSARASGLASYAPTQVPVAIAERVEGVEVALAEAADVRGRVVSAGQDSKGLAGVEIRAMSPVGPAITATSDEHGEFWLRGLLPGRVQLIADAEGWTLDEPPVVEIAGEDVEDLTLELSRAQAIRGRVEPAGAAEVAIELRPENLKIGGPGQTMMLATGGTATSSDAETGAFELSPVHPGTYTLEARTADGRGGSVEVEVGASGADEVVIELEQRAVLAGLVRDAEGRPVADATVRVRKAQTDSNSSLSVVVNGRELTAIASPTSEDGRYSLAGLADGIWRVEVVDERGDPLAWADGSRRALEVELGAGERREGFDLEVEARNGVIRGSVLTDEGGPVADAWVTASFTPPSPEPKDAPEGEGPRHEMKMVVASDSGGGSQAAHRPVLTDAEGRFEITGLRRGEYLLTAEANGGATTASEAGVRPDAQVELRLAPLAAIEGRVLSNGEPADCMLRLAGPSPRSAKVRDGRFELERLEPGTYTVTASAADGSTSTRVELEAGAREEVELALERFAKLSGTVVDEQGQAIAKAEILVGSGSDGRVEISRDGSEIPILTDADGKFETHAAAGQRVIVVQAPGSPMPIAVKPVVVVAGEDQDLGEIRKRDMSKMMRGGPEGPGGPGGHPGADNEDVEIE